MLLHDTYACFPKKKKKFSLAAAFLQSDSLRNEVMWFLEKGDVSWSVFFNTGIQKARIMFQHGFQQINSFEMFKSPAQSVELVKFPTPVLVYPHPESSEETDVM